MTTRPTTTVLSTSILTSSSSYHSESNPHRPARCRSRGRSNPNPGTSVTYDRSACRLPLLSSFAPTSSRPPLLLSGESGICVVGGRCKTLGIPPAAVTATPTALPCACAAGSAYPPAAAAVRSHDERGVYCWRGAGMWCCVGADHCAPVPAPWDEWLVVVLSANKGRFGGAALLL